jgi:DNA-binding response OmpR family regulator
MTMTDPPLILVADDDPDLLALLRVNLEIEGYTVTCALDGLEALEVAGRMRPALAVLDVMMPGLDGLEVTHRLRADPATEKMPIVLLTARGSDPQIWEGWQSGANYYVTKPFDVDQLLGFVANLLDNPEIDEPAVYQITTWSGAAAGDESP